MPMAAATADHEDADGCVTTTDVGAIVQLYGLLRGAEMATRVARVRGRGARASSACLRLPRGTRGTCDAEARWYTRM